MAGEGVMSHAIQSLRMNRRERLNIFDKENSNLQTNATRPLLLKKASKVKIAALEARSDLLKRRENIRLFISLLLLAVLGASCLIWLV